MKRSAPQVGERIEVHWPRDNQYYAGSVTKFYLKTKKYRIEYDDGEYEDLDLFTQKWRRTAKPRPDTVSEGRLSDVVGAAEKRIADRLVALEKAVAALRPARDRAAPVDKALTRIARDTSANKQAIATLSATLNSFLAGEPAADPDPDLEVDHGNVGGGSAGDGKNEKEKKKKKKRPQPAVAAVHAAERRLDARLAAVLAAISALPPPPPSEAPHPPRPGAHVRVETVSKHTITEMEAPAPAASSLSSAAAAAARDAVRDAVRDAKRRRTARTCAHSGPSTATSVERAAAGNAPASGAEAQTTAKRMRALVARCATLFLLSDRAREAPPSDAHARARWAERCALRTLQRVAAQLMTFSDDALAEARFTAALAAVVPVPDLSWLFASSSAPTCSLSSSSVSPSAAAAEEGDSAEPHGQKKKNIKQTGADGDGGGEEGEGAIDRARANYDSWAPPIEDDEWKAEAAVLRQIAARFRRAETAYLARVTRRARLPTEHPVLDAAVGVVVEAANRAQWKTGTSSVSPHRTTQ